MEPGHTFKDRDLAGKPAALYCRVSSNPDETEQRSVDEQEAEGRSWVKRTGVALGPADIFKDDDRSASMFAKRQRENFDRLRTAIEAEQYQIVWFWATSRQTRGDINIYDLAKASTDHSVLWCVGGQLLNPANEDDLMFLGIHHLMDRATSWRISKDVRRSKEADAHDGKPAGAVPYGYRNVLDFSVLVKGRPKYVTTEANVFDGNGRPIADSPAYVVREIYDRLLAGEGAQTIRKSLEERRIPLPRKPHKHTEFPFRWSAGTVRGIATNPAYIGQRTHHIEGIPIRDRHKGVLPGVETRWPALVTEEQWWAVQRIFSDPARLRYRKGEHGRRHLLSSIATCAECGGMLSVGLRPDRDYTTPMYRCQHRGCVSVREDWLDAYVDDVIVSWAADEDMYANLWQRRADDNAVASAARGDVEKLRHQIEECRVNGEDPDADAVFWERRSRSLAAKLAQAEELARPASLSPVLAGLIGPDAADKWRKLRQENPAAARQVIQMVAGISIRKTARRGGSPLTAIDPGRVGWIWKLGPGQNTEPVFGEPAPDMLREKITAALRAHPQSPDTLLWESIGCTPRAVQRVRHQLEDAGEIPVIRRKGRGKPVNHGYRSVT
jgi:site-specific DNA recombinase